MSSDISLTQAQRFAFVDIRGNVLKSARTQKRLSSGYKVSTVVDDVVNYFKAQQLDDNGTDVAKLRAEISQGIFLLETTLNTIASIDQVLGQLKGIIESVRAQSSIERSPTRQLLPLAIS